MEFTGEEPIVTISVITYNSAEYVIETLESIKSQTWRNLILHICDDCSKDNTVELCKKWIETYKGRFVKTSIIVPEHNTGVAANYNRSWEACETEYMKEIAGDDVLLPNCIEEFMKYVADNPNAIVTFSKVECFGEDKNHINDVDNFFHKITYPLFYSSREEKIDRLLTQGNFLPAPSAFVNIFKLRDLGICHDERIPMIEDAPKWANFLMTGKDFFFLNKTLVKYRIGSGISTTNTYESLSYVISRRSFFIYYKLPYCIEKGYLTQLDDLLKYETNLLIKCRELENSKMIRFKGRILSIISRIKVIGTKLKSLSCF